MMKVLLTYFLYYKHAMKHLNLLKTRFKTSRVYIGEFLNNGFPFE
jgi:hypothetical protein